MRSTSVLVNTSRGPVVDQVLHSSSVRMRILILRNRSARALSLTRSLPTRSPLQALVRFLSLSSSQRVGLISNGRRDRTGTFACGLTSANFTQHYHTAPYCQVSHIPILKLLVVALTLLAQSATWPTRMKARPAIASPSVILSIMVV